MFQVRNVPDELHSRLRERAAAAGLSLSDYALQALAALAARPTQAEVFARAAASDGRLTVEQVLGALDVGRAER